jgi:hypothetical protein
VHQFGKPADEIDSHMHEKNLWPISSQNPFHVFSSEHHQPGRQQFSVSQCLLTEEFPENKLALIMGLQVSGQDRRNVSEQTKGSQNPAHDFT